MTTAALGQLQAAVRREGLARDVAVAEVSVDPWRDTPARLRAYRRLTGTGIDLLTGIPDQLRRLWRFLGVYYKRVPQGHPPDVDWLTGRPERFDVQHSDGLFIVDPAGRWRMGTVRMPSVGGRIAAPVWPGAPEKAPEGSSVSPAGNPGETEKVYWPGVPLKTVIVCCM